MVSVAPHRAAAAEEAVDGLRDPHGEALAAAGESGNAVRLDEEVDVIRLHTEIKDPEARAGGHGESAADGSEDSRAAERGDAGGDAQGDVDGEAGIVRGAAAVRHGAPPRRRRATGAGTAAAPGAEHENALRRGCHLDWGRDYIKLARMSSDGEP